MRQKKQLEKKGSLASTVAALNHSRHESIHSVTLFGKKFVVLLGVFSPKYFDDAKFFGARLPKMCRGKKFLEIGPGTGILSVLCALQGAAVTAIDINPSAVKNSHKNAWLHGVKIDIREGNLFSPLKPSEKFDLIFWNHPFAWTRWKPKDLLEGAVVDQNYSSVNYRGLKPPASR